VICALQRILRLEVNVEPDGERRWRAVTKLWWEKVNVLILEDDVPDDQVPMVVLDAFRPTGMRRSKSQLPALT
jgi:hypothetical protein